MRLTQSAVNADDQVYKMACAIKTHARLEEGGEGTKAHLYSTS